MKTILTTAALAATLISGMAFAQDAIIPGRITAAVPRAHIAAMGQDLNAQHQQVTKTQEGVWADNSGSISADEAALTSSKPPVKGHPELMPHRGNRALRFKYPAAFPRCRVFLRFIALYRGTLLLFSGRSSRYPGIRMPFALSL
jgi:hypothetical protein